MPAAAPLFTGARALWYNTHRQFKICSVLRYRWTRLKPGKFYARVHEARDAPAMGAFPFVSLAGFSRAPTESRTGIVPSSFPARETKAKRGKEKRKMAMAATSCRVNGNTVYVYDENGGICDIQSYAQPIKNAVAFGGGYSVTAGYLTYTYTLSNGTFVQTGVHQA